MRPALVGFFAAVLVLTVSDLAVLHVSRSAAATFDDTVRLAVHGLSRPGWTRVIEVLTWLGSPGILASLAALVFLTLRLRGYSRLAWFPLITLAIAATMTEIAKVIVRRARPEPWFGLHALETWSFPSGHSLQSMACYLVFGTVLLPLVRSPILRGVIASLAIVLPLFIGFTRIYLGVHWPTDVLTGWAAGACVAAGLIRASRAVSGQQRLGPVQLPRR